nr:MAG TPA: hypothetical protein [Caudoviricetes sp.]
MPPTVEIFRSHQHWERPVLYLPQVVAWALVRLRPLVQPLVLSVATAAVSLLF